MIFIGVGTFAHGFDALVAGADAAAARLGLDGFAQIGHSAVLPRRLAYARFLPPAELRARLQASELAVCHAGMGLVGDALRAGCRLLLVPRQGATSRRHPANDQRGFALRLAERLPVSICLDPTDLAPAIARALALPRPEAPPPASNVPCLLRNFLAADGVQSRPAASSNPFRLL